MKRKKISNVSKKKGKSRVKRPTLINLRIAKMRYNNLNMNAVAKIFGCGTSWISKALNGCASEKNESVKEICKFVDSLPLGA